MREVGVLEAKTKLSSLLSEVERGGEEIIVTRYGRPIARLAPAVRRSRLPAKEVSAMFKGVREGVRRRWDDEPEFDWRAAIDQGWL